MIAQSPTSAILSTNFWLDQNHVSNFIYKQRSFRLVILHLKFKQHEEGLTCKVTFSEYERSLSFLAQMQLICTFHNIPQQFHTIKRVEDDNNDNIAQAHFHNYCSDRG